MLIKNGMVSSSSCFAKRGAGCGGRAYCLPIFFFLCFGKIILKECQKKLAKQEKEQDVIFHGVKHLLENAEAHIWVSCLLCYMNYVNYMRRESAKSLSCVNLRFKNYP